MINYRLRKYYNDELELISLDNIGRLIGYDQNRGSNIGKSPSKLANELNKIIKKKSINIGKILFSNYEKKDLIIELNKHNALVICISYYQYVQFIKNNDFNLEYYKVGEEPTIMDTIEHCITIIKNDNNIFGIDPQLSFNKRIYIV